MEVSQRSITDISNRIDECGRRVAKESRSLENLNDSVGLGTHQPCAQVALAASGSFRTPNLSQGTRGGVKGPFLSIATIPQLALNLIVLLIAILPVNDHGMVATAWFE
jgi:hypothetical protein